MLYFCAQQPAALTRCKLNRLAAVMLAACILATALLPATAQAVEATLLAVEITRDEPGERPGLFVADHYEFDLPQPLIDALHRGISLYFTHEFSLVQTRWYWFDKPLQKANSQFALLSILSRDATA